MRLTRRSRRCRTQRRSETASLGAAARPHGARRLGRRPAQTSAWLEPILSKVDAAGGTRPHAPACRAHDPLDGTKAAALTAGSTRGSTVLGPLTSVDPHSKLSSIVLAKNAVSRAAAECAARLAREDGSGRRARPLRPALGRLHAAVRVAPQPRARARRREDRRARAARRRVGRELHRARRRARRHARPHGRARGRPVGPRPRPEQLRGADERGLRADRAAGHGRRRRS